MWLLFAYFDLLHVFARICVSDQYCLQGKFVYIYQTYSTIVMVCAWFLFIYPWAGLGVYPYVCIIMFCLMSAFTQAYKPRSAKICRRCILGSLDVVCLLEVRAQKFDAVYPCISEERLLIRKNSALESADNIEPKIKRWHLCGSNKKSSLGHSNKPNISFFTGLVYVQ